ncbi:RrF2 family transcriptional regulator [Saccharothrix obliqua]|uniref:RrF2 family transcriptional regulator n=1 Tax=Saccharothrix obliqua TaxID=2861747 RepID=UPI001C60466D|nr:Rrf2 family transcriptional regulator [Saccharothrix obliqua]MBW4718563.1 Rrf2 family transcriptional regulator [Saccharothrix obliqua]
MQLTRATDIALRVLMLTATRSGLSTVDDLATALAVPRNHLAKVVQKLAHRGLLVTVRGRSGGLRIAPEALQWTVGQVVRDFEGQAEVVDCDEVPCPLRGACRLRGALRRAHAAFLAELDDVPLHSLVGPPTGDLLAALIPG